MIVRLLLLVSLAPLALSAQWRIALLAGSAVSHGDARATADPAQLEIRPDHPTTVTLAVTRVVGPWRLAATLHHQAADLAEVSGSASVATLDALHAWGVAAELSHRLAGRDGGPAWHLLVGAGADRWTFDVANDTPRWRATVRTGSEVELPISSRWAALIRTELSLGGSIFNADELPEGFARRRAARAGWSLGIARRL